MIALWYWEILVLEIKQRYLLSAKQIFFYKLILFLNLALKASFNPFIFINNSIVAKLKVFFNYI